MEDLFEPRARTLSLPGDCRLDQHQTLGRELRRIGDDFHDNVVRTRRRSVSWYISVYGHNYVYGYSYVYGHNYAYSDNYVYGHNYVYSYNYVYV